MGLQFTEPASGHLRGVHLDSSAVVALVMASCGGLMVTMLSASEQSKASEWNQAGNFGGGVLGAAIVLWLIDRLCLPLVGLAAAALVALPAYIALTIAEPLPRTSPWFRGRLSHIQRAVTDAASTSHVRRRSLTSTIGVQRSMKIGGSCRSAPMRAICST
jgi:hypothetical protein